MKKTKNIDLTVECLRYFTIEAAKKNTNCKTLIQNILEKIAKNAKKN